MIEADALADELIALNESELRHRTGFAVSREATGWLRTAHPEISDPTVLRQFHLAILARVDAVWPEERSNVRVTLANLYRQLMLATDLAATRAFIASPAGQSFGRMLVGADIHLLDDAASGVLYRRLFPELPELLAAAQKPAAE
ncbi:hypothetical protein L7H23_15955 [Sphingopyxis sp. BSN-002]|uniref:hypothetical protein n=1 Tax=Sphingopyxis sp. BSN-002 TaxID=2911495 RepID=UPI001EDADAC2|nr:hypothetical protein [Sphingopyxis sp. BSN-002]UKK84042.1 hypothetical protein L7H23_15955 [Sphingopyxis sp. BSN-002]